MQAARDELDSLFQRKSGSDTRGGRFNSKESLERAVSILKAYPSLVSQPFLFRCPVLGFGETFGDRGEIQPELFPLYRLFPLHHVLKSAAVDLESVQAVCQLAVANDRPRMFYGGCVSPLHVACCYKEAATKEILSFLITKDPSATTKPERDGITPFGCYVTHCIIPDQPDDAAFEANNREICDLLWSGLVEASSGIYRERALLTTAISTNCQPLIKYLVGHIPEAFWDRLFKFCPSHLSLHATAGLRLVLPKVKVLRCSLDDVHYGAYQQLVQEFGSDSISCNELYLVLPRLEYTETIREFGNSIGVNKSLKRLSLDGTNFLYEFPHRSSVYFDAIVNGMGQNQGIQTLRMANKFTSNFDGFCALLQNAPKELQFIDCTVLSSPTGATFDDARIYTGSAASRTLVNACRLEELIISGCKIEAANLVKTLQKLASSAPLLKKLTIVAGRPLEGRSLSSFDSQAVFNAVVPLLEQQQLNELHFCMRVTGSIAPFCKALENNRSLSRARLYLRTCTVSQYKMIANVLRDYNTTLQSFSSDHPTRSVSMLGHQAIEYYCLLNECGRGKVRDIGTKMEEFVNLLSNTIGKEYIDRAYEAGTANMLYGLLRERPSLWVDAGVGEIPASEAGNSERKRKRNHDEP